MTNLNPTFGIIDGEIPARPSFFGGTNRIGGFGGFSGFGGVNDPPSISSSFIGTPEFLDDVAQFGRYYYPASSHYPEKIDAIVHCDQCGKNNLVACIGYRSKDLCLTCTDKILDRKNNQTFDLPKPHNPHNPPYPPLFPQPRIIPPEIFPPNPNPNPNLFNPPPTPKPFGPNPFDSNPFNL